MLKNKNETIMVIIVFTMIVLAIAMAVKGLGLEKELAKAKQTIVNQQREINDYAICKRADKMLDQIRAAYFIGEGKERGIFKTDDDVITYLTDVEKESVNIIMSYNLDQLYPLNKDDKNVKTLRIQALYYNSAVRGMIGALKNKDTQAFDKQQEELDNIKNKVLEVYKNVGQVYRDYLSGVD
jgi:uncharacterized membrane-anchored protein YhcB (DUF1043 family)